MVPLKRTLSLAAMVIMIAAFAFPITAAAQSGSSQLTVSSQTTSGQVITGYYAVLFQNGNSVATGFTPASFTLNNGQSYVIQVDDYGGCYFQYWADTGSTSASRSITIYTDTNIVAVYQCGGSKSSVTVSSVDSSGGAIFGYYTVLYDASGNVAAAGFTTKTFPTTPGDNYSVGAENYGSCTFSAWSNGVASNPMQFTATTGAMSFTAVYLCGTPAPTPSVVQACYEYQAMVQTISCTLPDNVQAGDMIVVQLDEVNIYGFNDSMGNTFTLLTTQNLPTSTYNMYLYYAIAKSSGPDTITLSGNGNYPSMLVTELRNVNGISAYYSNSGESATPSVTSYTPPVGSLNMGFLLAYGNGETATAGPGYTLVQQTYLSVVDEYAIISGATSPSFVLSAPNPWTEVAVTFS